MKRTNIFLALTLMIAALRAPASSPSAYVPLCGPAVPFICAAADTGDDGKLREALTLGLTSSDASIRHETIVYLGNWQTLRLDPRALRDALLRFDVLEGSNEGEGFLETSSLALASKQERQRTYRQAIAEGAVSLGPVVTLRRAVAMNLAVDDGMSELGPLIEKHFATLSEGERQSYGSLERAQIRLMLRDGALDLFDADAKALERLSAIEASDLGAKLKSSKAWREVLEETTRSACRERSSRSCEIARGVVERQLVASIGPASKVAAKAVKRDGGDELVKWLDSVMTGLTR